MQLTNVRWDDLLSIVDELLLDNEWLFHHEYYTFEVFENHAVLDLDKSNEWFDC